MSRAAEGGRFSFYKHIGEHQPVIAREVKEAQSSFQAEFPNRSSYCGNLPHLRYIYGKLLDMFGLSRNNRGLCLRTNTRSSTTTDTSFSSNTKMTHPTCCTSMQGVVSQPKKPLKYGSREQKRKKIRNTAASRPTQKRMASTGFG